MALNTVSNQSHVDRKIRVGNLPQNCVRELLEHYFESKKHFGEGILVEDINFQDDEAVITFQKASDVDQILQHHERKPCELVNTKLTINSCRPYGDSDACDTGSFLLVQNEHGSLRCNSLQKYPSLSSLATDVSCDSSELFGSGRSKDQIFSKEFLQLHIIYQQNEQEKHVLNLNETDISPVVISYAATTCSTRENKQTREIDRKSHLRSMQNNSPTILQDVMRTKFGDNVEIITDNMNVLIIRTGQIQTVTNEEEFQKDVLATMKKLESRVSIELLELDAERSEFAFKHFAQILDKNQTVKIFSADDDFSFFIAYLTDDEKFLIKEHIAIVSNQGIIKQEKQLSFTDIFKIEANRKKLDSQKAVVKYVENCIVLEGFEEDVNSTNTVINMILCTSHCIPRKLDKFACDLLREKEIIAEIEMMLNLTKVWWKVSDPFLNVVARNEKHAIEAADKIESFFKIHKIEMTDYLLDSEKWQTEKNVALINHQKRLFIDDKSKNPIVIIRGTKDACNSFADTAEGFKKENIRCSETHHMTEAKCMFALKHLNESIEVNTKGEYFKLKHGKNQTELVVQATEGNRKAITAILSEISTLQFWICDENDGKILKSMSENKDLRVPGTITVFENQTQIIFKTGRIENEQTDVIVNSASEDLKLDTGDKTITRSIIMAAGEQAQKCLDEIKGPVQVGEVIKGDAGKLKCKTLLHAVLMQYNAEDNTLCLKVLRNVIRKCLTKASNSGYTRLAFPALCTGVHKYPVKTVADTMFNSITEFLCQNEQCSLKEIIIVFLDSDKNKKKAFEECKAVREQTLVGMKGHQKLSTAIPWPCRYYCHITAPSQKDAKEHAEKVVAELKEQTLVKRLEHTE